MNRITSPKQRIESVLGFIAACTAICVLFLPLVHAGADGKSEKKTGTTASGTLTEKQNLTGQELYAINCNRCHSERYPTEWTPSQWKTIMLHMQVRANLPADQAKVVLKYLQEESGN